MKYVIEAEVLIEFKSLVDRFDYEQGEKFDGFKYEPVQDAAKRYSDGEDRFFKMFDSAVDKVNETIWAVDDYLKFYTGRTLEEYFTVNFAGLDCVKLNRESVVLDCDDNSEIDREKLFRLIRDRFHDVMLFGEIARYTDNARFGKLEIEYR